MKICASIVLKLEEHGHMITWQRKQIISLLAENKTKHLSADDIYHDLRHTSIGLATVYRTLALLEQYNLVGKITTEDGTVRYELTPAGSRDHFHFVCIACGKIIELSPCLEGPCSCTELAIEKYGVTVQEKNMTLYGLCQDCQKNV